MEKEEKKHKISTNPTNRSNEHANTIIFKIMKYDRKQNMYTRLTNLITKWNSIYSWPYLTHWVNQYLHKEHSHLLSLYIFTTALSSFLLAITLVEI